MRLWSVSQLTHSFLFFSFHSQIFPCSLRAIFFHRLHAVLLRLLIELFSRDGAGAVTKSFSSSEVNPLTGALPVKTLQTGLIRSSLAALTGGEPSRFGCFFFIFFFVFRVTPEQIKLQHMSKVNNNNSNLKKTPRVKDKNREI